MKLLKNRLLVSIIGGGLITGFAFLIYAFIIKPGNKTSILIEARNTLKRFDVLLTFDIDSKNLKTQYPYQYVVTKEIEVLKERVKSLWFDDSIYFNKEYKIIASFHDVYHYDTSLLITSLYLSQSVRFWEIYTIEQISPIIEALNVVEKKEVNRQNAAEEIINFAKPYTDVSGSTFFPPQIGYVKEKDTSIARNLLNDTSIIKLIPNDLIFMFGEMPGNETYKEKYFSIYAIRTNGNFNDPSLSEKDIENAGQDFSNSGEIEVKLIFNKIGSGKWAKLTRSNVGKSIAIVINNFVVSAPTVTAPITEGTSSITGKFTISEAQILAFQLRSRPLPFPIILIHHETKELKQPFYKRHLIYLMCLSSLIILSILIYYLYPLLSSENKSF